MNEAINGHVANSAKMHIPRKGQLAYSISVVMLFCESYRKALRHTNQDSTTCIKLPQNKDMHGLTRLSGVSDNAKLVLPCSNSVFNRFVTCRIKVGPTCILTRELVGICKMKIIGKVILAYLKEPSQSSDNQKQTTVYLGIFQRD